MMESSDPGPTYTPGQSFRARAEERQREYRSQVLKVGWGRYGHFLAEDAANVGANFIVPEAFAAAKERRDQGKGVAQRTFDNMLSSQAMCFNLFTPLSLDLGLASKVFQHVVPAVGTVKSITFEYTPPNEVFGDQTGRGGVDCDLLVEAEDASGAAMVLVIETKFVEPEFSTCGFRRAGRQSKGQAVCPDDVVLGQVGTACLYSSSKNYRYWERTWEAASLRRDALPAQGCPFVGPLWQLWVNHTLAHIEARQRGVPRAMFAVCAPEANDALDAPGNLAALGGLVADRDSLTLIGVNSLIQAIGQHISGEAHQRWHQGLANRYGGI